MSKETQNHLAPCAFLIEELRLYGGPKEVFRRVLWVDYYKRPDGSTPDLDHLIKAAKSEGGIDGGAKTLSIKPMFFKDDAPSPIP